MIDITEIKKLSVDERLEMVEAILDSIAEDTHKTGSITKEQQEEVIRRIDLIESGEAKTYSWEEAKRKLSL
jgi:putative addiction module component (TIGR02574 family)